MRELSEHYLSEPKTLIKLMESIMIRFEQYQRLERHLRADGRLRIEMTFAQAARIIGEQLPYSASHHPAWWGSDPKHTQAVWLDAGYVASPDLAAERVTFTKITAATPIRDATRER